MQLYKRFLIILIVCGCFIFTSCKSENVFRDYTATESYNSSVTIIDLTNTASIITTKYDARLINYIPTITAGGYSSITLKLEPETNYSIEVEYASGISKAKTLSPKTSRKNGYVSWEWQVGGRVAAGEYPVRIYKGNELVFETRLIVE